MNIRIIILSCLFSVIGFAVDARDFGYAYHGQALTYTVIDEEAKTCCTKAGYDDGLFPHIRPGNHVYGPLEIPEFASDGTQDYRVVEIGDFGFTERFITTAVLPPSIEVIGAMAFYHNPLESVNLPAALKTIGYEAFYATRLKEIVLPASLETIGDHAFYCNLESVVTEGTVPPAIESESFSGDVYATAFITVPEGSEKEYMSAPNWDQFVNYPSVVDDPKGYFLIGDFNNWNLPAGSDYKGAIRMKSFVSADEAIGGGYDQVAGVNLKGLGKFVAYYPPSTFIGFDPNWDPRSFEKEGNTYNYYAYSLSQALEDVIPFEITKRYGEGEDAILQLISTPFAICVINGTLSSELLDMVAVEEVVGEKRQETGRYTTAGVPVDANYKGLAIVRYADGCTRKVVVK